MRRFDTRSLGSCILWAASCIFIGSSVLVAVPIGSSCAAQESEIEAAFPAPKSWRELAPGIEIAEATASDPRPLRIRLAKINLETPGLEFQTTEGNADAEGEVNGLLTSSFLTRHDCLLAINAGPFQPVLLVEGKGHDVLGLQVNEGEVVSPGDPSTATLWGTRSGSIRISERAPDAQEVWWAVPGFEKILESGQVVARDIVLHPRTAVGVSEDGSTMIWLVVDGRQQGYSEGATTIELAQWLKELGMSEGINLDGGGTSTMVMRDENRPSGYAVLNRPIHGGIPSLQRVSASHLGIRLAPQPDSDQDESMQALDR